jgi:sulfur-oxidizing protein SoxA
VNERLVRRRALVAGALLLSVGALVQPLVTPPASRAAADATGSRAIPEARGDVEVQPDGRRRAVRYKGWPTTDYARFRTYAYDDRQPEPGIQRATPPAAVVGDPARGRALFLSRSMGPCTGCHLVPGDDVWPAGSVGPDLSQIGDRGLSDAHLYAVVYDARHLLPRSIMPPWGTSGAMTPAQIVDVVAYLQSLRGPRPPERDAERDPSTRRRPPGFGDNLDPTNNPAVLIAEGAEDRFKAPGPAGKACADCHRDQASLRGVATRYPAFVKRYGRVMAIEDLLSAHGPATTGDAYRVESAENLAMTLFIKMASNGMPVAVDTQSPEARDALARGRASFERRVGERNHACADCHTPEFGAGKFLGGRMLGDVTAGLTRHFPTWRTSQAEVWDMRKRFQWCMTPLGTNMLAADAVEYAELELYLTSFDNGKALSVPGIRH